MCIRDSPGVDSVVEGADGDDDADQAAQGGRQRGDTDLPVLRVGQDDRVGGEGVAVALEDGRERLGPDLLFALDEDGDRDRKVVPEGAQGGDCLLYTSRCV